MRNGWKLQRGEMDGGESDCPKFILTEKEEERISRPWRNGGSVKLLGRKIGFKALENRLQ